MTDAFNIYEVATKPEYNNKIISCECLHGWCNVLYMSGLKVSVTYKV